MGGSLSGGEVEASTFPIEYNARRPVLREGRREAVRLQDVVVNHLLALLFDDGLEIVVEYGV
jgi:hypothetical protein